MSRYDLTILNIDTGEETSYRCVSGHDMCHLIPTGPDCPYCEKVEPEEPMEALEGPLRNNITANAVLAGTILACILVFTLLDRIGG